MQVQLNSQRFSWEFSVLHLRRMEDTFYNFTFDFLLSVYCTKPYLLPVA